MARGRKAAQGSARTQHASEKPAATDANTHPEARPTASRTTTRSRGGAAREAASSAVQPAVPMPEEAEVVAAVGSLYDDQLRPYSRILRKRLGERAEACGLDARDCDAGRLRALCSACPALRVEAVEGGEWSALVVDREPAFIDIYSTSDDYPEDLWAAAAEYFAGLGNGSSGALPGGRYASAQALAVRKLQFLEGYTLGQVCHITQLAISQRSLLGYYNGAIVPYTQSTSMMKSQCAQEQKPIAGTASTTNAEGQEFVVVDWDTAREKLREILASAAVRGSEHVPLSNVKRLFRSLYHMELSETALGHSKLTELLQDARFHDLCTVQLQDRGYVVVPVKPAGAAAGAQVAEATGSGESSDPSTPMKASGTRSISTTPPKLAAGRRSGSVPSDKGSPKASSPVCIKGGEHPPAGAAAHDEDVARVRFCPDEPLCFEEADLGPGRPPWSPMGFPFPLMTPSPQYKPQYAQYASTFPVPGSDAWEVTCRALGLLPRPEDGASGVSAHGSQAMAGGWSGAPWPAQQTWGTSTVPECQPEEEEQREEEAQRVKFCQDEPLCLEDALGAPQEAFVSPGPWTPTPLYPSRAGAQAKPQLLPEPRVVRIAGLV